MTATGSRARCLLVLLLLSLAGAVAHAHKSSDAYLTWQVHGSRVDERIDVALRDLERELALDADADGRLTWREVRTRWRDIEALVDAGVQWTAPEARCVAEPRAQPQLERHSDGRYAVLQRRWTCAAPVQAMQLSYSLFEHGDATHRGIARLEGARRHQAVLVPGGATLTWPLGAGAEAARGFGGFVAEGLHHILAGADHVLFLLTLLVVAVWRRDGGRWQPVTHAGTAWRETLRLVTAFTLGHSVTLAMAASGVLAPPSRWVESLIAFSVLVAALDNLWPRLPAPRWVVVALFGLVHGFGFAGPLQDLGLSRQDLWRPLLGFNLGVELGQLAIVAAALPLALMARHAPRYDRWVVRGGSSAVAVLALGWTLERSLALSWLP